MTHLILTSLLLAAEPAPAAAPLTLEQIVQKASADNLELAAAREKIAQADAQLAKAWAALLPVVTLGGAYTRNSDEALLGLPDFRQPFTLLPDPAGSGGTYLVPGGLVEAVIQPKDQWGAMGKVMLPLLVMPAYAGIGAAEDGLLATEAAVEHARSELLFGVAQAYYGAVASQRLVELAEKQLASAQAQEKLAAARVAAGQAPKIFALRAGVDRARTEQDLRRAQNAHAQAKLVLVQLCGLEADFTVVAPTAPVGTDGPQDEQLRAALEGRKDLLAARHGAIAASDALDAAWWSFFPVLVGSGEYRWSNVEGFSGETTTWLLQLAAQWTIYDGGRYADLDGARSRLREAELSRDATVRKIEQEVKSARLELESARANLDKAREQERLAIDNLALVEAQVGGGLATYLEATDAQTVRFAAGVGVVAEELNVHVAGLKLLKAGGRLFEALPRG